MTLKKILTILFILDAVFILGLIVINNEFLFIEDHGIWINVIIGNLVFFTVFFILTLAMANNYQKRIKKQDKVISDLKASLYDAIKDDEEREKMLKNFEKSLK